MIICCDLSGRSTLFHTPKNCAGHPVTACMCVITTYVCRTLHPASYSWCFQVDRSHTLVHSLPDLYICLCLCLCLMRRLTWHALPAQLAIHDLAAPSSQCFPEQCSSSVDWGLFDQALEGDSPFPETALAVHGCLGA